MGKARLLHKVVVVSKDSPSFRGPLRADLTEPGMHVLWRRSNPQSWTLALHMADSESIGDELAEGKGAGNAVHYFSTELRVILHCYRWLLSSRLQPSGWLREGNNTNFSHEPIGRQGSGSLAVSDPAVFQL
jgi:hypothetical protein